MIVTSLPVAVTFLLIQAAELSRLSSPVAAERVAALDAIRGLPDQHRELLEPVAAALEDEDSEVRKAAAYALTQLALRLGCLPGDYVGCKAFDSVLDNTPVPEKKFRIDFPDAAKRQLMDAVVFVQFLVREDGTVADLKKLRGPDLFANPILKQLEGQRYKPARRRGKPVTFAYIMRVSFAVSVGPVRRSPAFPDR